MVLKLGLNNTSDVGKTVELLNLSAFYHYDVTDNFAVNYVLKSDNHCKLQNLTLIPLKWYCVYMHNEACSFIARYFRYPRWYSLSKMIMYVFEFKGLEVK